MSELLRPPGPEWLRGLWRRRSLRHPDGRVDDSLARRHTDGASWRIERSTMPFREGASPLVPPSIAA